MTKQLRNFVVMPFKETGLFYKASLYELKSSEDIAGFQSIIPVLVWPKAERDANADTMQTQRRANAKKMGMSYQGSDRSRPMFFWNLPKVGFGSPEMYAIQKYIASEIGIQVKELNEHARITFLTGFL